jgi:CheY-like chemotaxis protein
MVWMKPKLVSIGLISRRTPHNMVRRWGSGQKQYQSTMDGPHEMPHCFLMEYPKDRGGDKRQRLSVVVDDDESVRESLPDLLKEFGFAARAFSSAEEFLSSGCVDETSCLILDVAMPGMSGPDLQQELKHRGQKIPIIFITGQRNETIRARVLKQGAAGFLLKPFSDEALLAAIKAALQAI